MAELENGGGGGGGTPYERKSKVVNKAVQDMGMGRYQWELFALCGMGWLADNLWMAALSLVLPRLSTEFGVSETTIRYTTTITFVGLSIGSVGWGIASDIIGRRPAFNATLFLCGAFGLAAAFGPNWPATAALFALMGVGVGGNLPVDGALFLEVLPADRGGLLTLLSAWWPVGQVVAALIAIPLIPGNSCEADLSPCSQTKGVKPCCAPEDNRGWRYFIFSLGVLTLFMFACRFFLFHLYESPKFLLSRGRQSEAVAVVHGIARHNKTHTWLTEEILDAIGGHPGEEDYLGPSATELGRRKLSAFSLEVLRPLFKERLLGITTILLWFIWAAIGMGYPLFNAFLPQYLEHTSTSLPTSATTANEATSEQTVYISFLITSLFGIPGSLLAAYTVGLSHPLLGRKGTMALSTLLSGLFLFLFTLSPSPGYQTFCASVEAFSQNVMYGVLYAYTPEVFPAQGRGTGTGVASLGNRIMGMVAPVVAAAVGELHPVLPILLAGGCYGVAFLAMVALPIETRGRESL
ncbi:putative sugar transporter [Aulographum hederae CBS 113979]|uniref:Putative sugar transporter n=1 Tax=Aulographum hederae CBS 113979 TaxID=1176131 RepID=A0A6G1H8K5_9PEZI|nr:putative sugar transporter [Aulographum hederae CBS 113979]